MLLWFFKYFFPWFVANPEARCRADARRSQDKNTYMDTPKRDRKTIITNQNQP